MFTLALILTAAPSFNLDDKPEAPRLQFTAAGEAASESAPVTNSAAEPEQDAEEAAEAAAAELLKKKCGRDYHRLRIGEAWSRVKMCVPMEWRIKSQDVNATVYEAAGGYVRVERGRVTRWIAP